MVILLLTIICVILAVVVAYLVAECRNLRIAITNLKEDKQALTKERNDALSRLLVKHGSTPIDHVAPKPKNVNPAPIVVQRAMMEQRHEQAEALNTTTAVNTHATNVTYSRVQQETLEKAKKIVK